MNLLTAERIGISNLHELQTYSINSFQTVCYQRLLTFVIFFVTNALVNV